MGFIKAFTGALSGSFANQWLEYMAPPASMTDHVLLARATPVKVNGSENNDGEENANVISNGSKFLVPEGTCLITMENGGITGVISEPVGVRNYNSLYVAIVRIVEIIILIVIKNFKNVYLIYTQDATF